jgi:hypothetical protein
MARDNPEARAERHRQWTEAFEPDFRENEREGRDLNTGLSEKQKNWIKEAWTVVTGSWHCVFPVYDGDKPKECGKREKVEAHHIYPQGASKRLNEDPDKPRNIVPLCDQHHRKGQRGRELTREEQDVVHLDSAWANRVYPDNKDSYQEVAKQRSELLDEGKEYWVPFWDTWFRKQADEVVSTFVAQPETPDYPENKNQKDMYSKIWDFQKKEWVDS